MIDDERLSSCASRRQVRSDRDASGGDVVDLSLVEVHPGLGVGGSRSSSGEGKLKFFEVPSECAPVARRASRNAP